MEHRGRLLTCDGCLELVGAADALAQHVDDELLGPLVCVGRLVHEELLGLLAGDEVDEPGMALGYGSLENMRQEHFRTKVKPKQFSDMTQGEYLLWT